MGNLMKGLPGAVTGSGSAASTAGTPSTLESIAGQQMAGDRAPVAPSAFRQAAMNGLQGLQKATAGSQQGPAPPQWMQPFMPQPQIVGEILPVQKKSYGKY